jgi:hypothetical protein
MFYCLSTHGIPHLTKMMFIGDAYLESQGLEHRKSPLCANKIHPFIIIPLTLSVRTHLQRLVSVWLTPSNDFQRLLRSEFGCPCK